MPQSKLDIYYDPELEQITGYNHNNKLSDEAFDESYQKTTVRGVAPVINYIKGSIDNKPFYYNEFYPLKRVSIWENNGANLLLFFQYLRDQYKELAEYLSRYYSQSDYCDIKSIKLISDYFAILATSECFEQILLGNGKGRINLVYNFRNWHKAINPILGELPCNLKHATCSSSGLSYIFSNIKMILGATWGFSQTCHIDYVNIAHKYLLFYKSPIVFVDDCNTHYIFYRNMLLSSYEPSNK